MMDISSLFAVYPPEGEFLPGYALLVAFGLLLYLPILFRRGLGAEKYLKKSIRRRFRRNYIYGVLGMLCILGRFGEIPYASMPILWIILLTGGVIDTCFVIFSIVRDYRRRVASVQREKDRS